MSIFRTVHHRYCLEIQIFVWELSQHRLTFSFVPPRGHFFFSVSDVQDSLICEVVKAFLGGGFRAE